MRTIVDLPEHQLRALGAWCEREKISRAEAIRRALDLALEQRRPSAREAFFGAWSPRGDSRDAVDALRGEWGR